MFLRSVDLNLDAGESLEALLSGQEEALYKLVSSVSVACGGHTGDIQSMSLAIQLAKKYRLRIGAHPSYPDKVHFGRNQLKMPKEDLLASLQQQVQDLAKICTEQAVEISYIKPHGALYNLAANELETANVLIQLQKSLPKLIPIMTLAGSKSESWYKTAGLQVLSEAFVDRRYEVDGTLRSRKYSDALLVDANECAEQAVKLTSSSTLHVDTLCIHGDRSDALEIAKAVREKLTHANIRIH